MANRIAVAGLSVVCVLALLAAGPAGASTGAAPRGSRPQAPASVVLAQPGQAYIHTSTSLNSFLNVTYLDNPALNHQPGTKFFAIDNLAPYGFGTLADHPEGVLYDSAVHRWAIYNDDLSAMSLKRSFNVFIPPQDSTVIVDTSSVLNSSGPETRIQHAPFNDPNAVIFVQHVFNPGATPAAGDSPAGGPTTTYTHTVAVTYDAGAGFWAIRNADGTNFPPNIAFNVLEASPDETFFVQTASAGSLADFAYATALNNPLLNGNPDAQVLVTQNYGAGLANDHRVGVGYWPPTQRWYIFNQDLQPMMAGLEFNVLVIPPKTGYFVQTATALNTGAFNFASSIDNPDLNNNPDALVYVAHNRNPPEAPNELTSNHPLGVSFYAGAWYVVNLDLAPMTLGLTFNIYYTLPRGNSFSVSASSVYTSGTYMDTNSPLLNGKPNAAPIATSNETPAGLLGGNYTRVSGLRYNTSLKDWQIFNNTGTPFVITQTYNLLVAPDSFAVTATAPSGTHFDIDNPLTNGNPWALVFATPRDNGGINPKNIGLAYIPGDQKWVIFNEDLSPMTTNVAYDVFVTRIRLVLPLIQR
jgi:hypothetical protein